ncbi:glycosyltransferase family 92 protein RCOM_0530710-like [Telopea speciosissima]|uniref:glycosyltransferase family 92 protein RCOM_0530710-like n=1 Tax=Telopea speciosissima TaxID=54955 RepID=UPI001CC3DB62|nr:glycosyltransferase family 92 protein RCOM_0530710-like [Telopea speciosissima]
MHICHCKQMDSELQCRKRKHIPRRTPSSSLLSCHYSISVSLLLLLLCFCCFVLLLNSFSTIGSSPFRPVLIVSRLPLLSSSALAVSNSILHSSADHNDGGPLPFIVEDRVLFSDHVLLVVSKRRTITTKGLSLLHWNAALNCVYHPLPSFSNTNNSIESNELDPKNRHSISLSLLSVDEFDGYRSIARCPTPPANHSAWVLLERTGIRETQRSRGEELQDDASVGIGIDHPVHSWETSLVYGAALDGDTAVVFVKGLNLRPDRASDPTQFVCHFGWGNWQRNPHFVFTTQALTAAQEVVRCSLPITIRNNPSRANGIRVTIGVASLGTSGRVRTTPPLYIPLPSVAKIFHFTTTTAAVKKKYEMCVCTMVWNQASSLREWITYHAWLGVERWFIYDNNSDDNIKQVIDELDQENYNVSRHVWPWLKTQEAGFSHCTVRAKAECNWVGFMDVDEFFYFPVPSANRGIPTDSLGYPGRDSLKTLVANFSSSTTIGEIRTSCHSFGPSGLRTPPSQGVTVGYTCRLQSPERHKSIVRPNALDDTLLNVIHHFRLKTGYTYLNLPQSTAIINHYKYQVWEAFRAKFFRRVATYVAYWQENQNEGSKDRAPGLGTEAIEPPNWPLQFCEVWDTGLRDFVMANLADPANGVLPWWGSSLQ